MTATERMYDELHKQGKKGAELCKYLGISTSVLAGWKKQNTIPPSSYLVRICEFLDISVDYLLTGHERELPEDMDLTKGYDFEGNKTTISDEQAAVVRQIINKELNERVEEAVRKILSKE